MQKHYYAMRPNPHALVNPFATGPQVYRYANSHSRQRIMRRIDPAHFATVWLGAIVGLVGYRDSNYYRYNRVATVVAIAGNGKYLQLALVNSDDYNANKEFWAHASDYYRLADNLSEYGLTRQIAELEKKLAAGNRELELQRERELKQLSQNTVTKALVHASDNNYCAETAVALISAGHKLPDVTLSLDVTVSISVVLEGKRNYYPLRALFGATRGDVESATGIKAVERADAIYDAIHEQLGTEVIIGNVSHTGTLVEWHAPVLRMTESSDIFDEVMENQAPRY